MNENSDRVGKSIETARGRHLRRDLPIVADRGSKNGRSVLDEERAIAPEHIMRDLNFGDIAAFPGDLDSRTRIVDEFRVLDANVGDALRRIVRLEIDTRTRTRAPRILEHRIRYEDAVRGYDG